MPHNPPTLEISSNYPGQELRGQTRENIEDRKNEHPSPLHPERLHDRPHEGR